MRFAYCFALAALFVLTGCGSLKYKNINYLDQDYTQQESLPTLNIFRPKNTGNNNDVLIFVHGGNWDSGNKGLYSQLGRNFARKGMLTVIPGYTLSPGADVKTMTEQITEAVTWTHEHIKDFGGNPNRIFITGHSAGGHLAALATMNPAYLKDTSYIKGIILNDAAGLDMYSYLNEYPPTSEDHYLTTWGNTDSSWLEVSPINYIDENTPPMLIYLGTKTIPSIFKYNELFVLALQEVQPKVKPVLLDKKHKKMVIQYFWPWSKRFDEIKSFMKAQQ
ncbi:alpha/beta hydrolase [Flavimarina sp. Hel_I_48]|uniref:alpha/beta hydrolase n=1 Tax=Flavimarina sp. Hel_I_48 TaxID=1392488 RepID=UPI0004DF033F|nr:alpha/beta hydrolase [Flavimarina sp. Hel_I_48]